MSGSHEYEKIVKTAKEALLNGILDSTINVDDKKSYFPIEGFLRFATLDQCREFFPVIMDRHPEIFIDIAEHIYQGHFEVKPLVEFKQLPEIIGIIQKALESFLESPTATPSKEEFQKLLQLGKKKCQTITSSQEGVAATASAAAAAAAQPTPAATATSAAPAGTSQSQGK